MQEKTVFVGLLDRLFSDSFQDTLRVSLEFRPSRKKYLVSESVDVLFDMAYYKSLIPAHIESNKNMSDNDIALRDVHYFLTFLYCAKKAGFDVEPVQGSKVVLDDSPFPYDLYSVKKVSSSYVSRFVDQIFDNVYGADIIGFLYFLAYHVEVVFL